MSPLEIVAVLLGLINIVLIVRRSLWNYPFGIAMVTLYFFIFFRARLYSDTLLQVFFLVVQVYGLWCWLKGRDTQGELIVVRAGAPTMMLWALGIAGATGLWGWLMHRYTDAAFPWWDAAVAMISVGAQIMMSRRYIENWVAWVLVDALAIGLYASRDLWLTAGLYTMFLLIALWGWREWIIVGRGQRGVADPLPA
ncbi:MAG: nicotinamide mononucleotide transporter [Sphingobium sp.]|nr:nicotinamide mononucleotide transporter [Sphingobium sp.]